MNQIKAVQDAHYALDASPGKRRKTKPTPPLLNTTDSESQPDSGYGSNAGSQNTQPIQNTIKQTRSTRKYQFSLSPTMSVFDGYISPAYETRFQQIVSTVGQRVSEHIQKPSFWQRIKPNQRSTKPSPPLSIRLMVLGKTSEKALPYLVVLCSPGDEHRIQQFVRTDSPTQELCNPRDTSLPKFCIIAHGLAPKLTGGEFETSVQVVWDSSWFRLQEPNESMHSNTIYGVPIQFQAKGKTRNATLGGAIVLHFKHKPPVLCGLTADHAARACLTNNDLEDVETSPELENNGYAWESSVLEQNSGRDRVEEVLRLSTRHGKRDSVPQSRWDFQTSVHCGNVLMPEVSEAILTDQTARSSEVHHAQYFDWALVPVAKDFLNHIHSQQDFEAGAVTKCWQTIGEPLPTETRVLVLNRPGQAKSGWMLQTMAYILIHPGKSFVNTYLIEMEDGQEIEMGESGAWVISADTKELIGYVVATDVSGAAYVMPIRDVFSDIVKKHEATEVSLMSFRDIELLRSGAMETLADDGDSDTTETYYDAPTTQRELTPDPFEGLDLLTQRPLGYGDFETQASSPSSLLEPSERQNHALYARYLGSALDVSSLTEWFWEREHVIRIISGRNASLFTLTVEFDNGHSATQAFQEYNIDKSVRMLPDTNWILLEPENATQAQSDAQNASYSRYWQPTLSEAGRRNISSLGRRISQPPAILGQEGWDGFFNRNARQTSPIQFGSGANTNHIGHLFGADDNWQPTSSMFYGSSSSTQAGLLRSPLIGGGTDQAEDVDSTSARRQQQSQTNSWQDSGYGSTSCSTNGIRTMNSTTTTILTPGSSKNKRKRSR